eukprot:9740363-Karenia_brevis.AAC.1
MGIRRSVDDTLQQYIVKRRSAARKVLHNSTGTASFMFCIRAWNYYGHCLRNTTVPEVSAMMQFRSDAWWQTEKGKPGSWRVCHRHSGTQVTHHEQVFAEFLGPDFPTAVVAAHDRKWWRAQAVAF